MLCFALVFAASSSATSWAESWCAAHHKEHAVEAHHKHLAVVAALRAKVSQLESELGEVASLKAKVLQLENELGDCQEYGPPAGLDKKKKRPPSPSLGGQAQFFSSLALSRRPYPQLPRPAPRSHVLGAPPFTTTYIIGLRPALAPRRPPLRHDERWCRARTRGARPQGARAQGQLFGDGAGGVSRSRRAQRGRGRAGTRLSPSSLF